MHKLMTTALDLVGAGLIVTGIALVWVPAAFIAGGVGLLLISWRANE